MGYQTITQISRSFGRTVHQMKVILTEESLLGEDGPSPIAFETGASKLFPLTAENAKYGTNGKTHYPKWDADTVKLIMAKRGEAPGDRKIVRNVHDALSHLSRIGSHMEGMPGMDRNMSDMLQYSGHAGNLGLKILTDERSGVLTRFREAFEDVRKTALKKRGKWKTKATEIIATLDALEEFLARRGCT